MNYTSIRVSTLRGDQKIEFDAYIKLGDKYIHYLRRGDSFEGPRLKKLKEKSLKKMFILDEQESLYRQYLQTNIESAYDNKSKQDISIRSEIIQGSQQSQTEAVFENPENAVTYFEAKNAAGKYVEFLISNNSAISHILKIENNDQNIAHHGVTVATLAVNLAQELGLVTPDKMNLLALGGFLHDFGHQDSELDLKKKIKDMDSKELETWRSHPKAGADRVQDKKHFDAVVVKIIEQHEENCEGKGPKGLLEKQIDPLALVVSVTNSLDRLISFEQTAKDEIVKKFTLENMGKYPLNYLQKLNELMKKV